MLRKVVGEVTSGTELIGLRRRRRELASLPDGDGHPVVVAPGFLGGDGSTRLLRRFLGAKQYAAAGWGLGRNLGSVDLFERFADAIDEQAQRTGRSVSLVGWSLGGIAARFAASERPSSVRQVVTLGSPFRVDPREQGFYPIYARVSGVAREDFTEKRLRAVMATPPVPATSIVSPDDALVSPDQGFQPHGPTAETVEVRGSHVGLATNADVWRIVADRLAQPEGEWRPYRDVVRS